MHEARHTAPLTDEEAAKLQASVQQVVRDCGGDPIAALRALIFLNDAMGRELAELRQEVEEITAKVSRAYARDVFYRRLSHADKPSED